MDHIQNILEAMSAAGLRPKDSRIIIDDKWHAFKPDGHHKPTGAYCFKYVDGYDDVIGCFKDFRAPDELHKYVSKNKREYSPQEKAEFKTKIENERKERETRLRKQFKDTAIKANKIWDSAKSGTNGYCIKKQINGTGARVYRDVLIYPIRIDRKITSLQFISNDGDKRFLKHGEIKRGYHAIGTDKTTIYLTEGVATCESIYNVVKPFVCVASYTASNLLLVAEDLAKNNPDSRIVICADNDKWQKLNPTDADRALVGEWHDKNTGMKSGMKAAKSIKADFIYPDFPDDCQDTDFNDYAMKYGDDMLLKRLQNADNVGAFAGGDTSSCVVLDDSESPPSYLNDVPPHEYNEYEAPIIAAAPDDWKERLIMDKNGYPVKTSLQNTNLMVLNHEKYRGVFRYNEFKCDTMVVRCPPWEDESKFKPHRLNDNDITELTAHMEYYGMSPDTSRVLKAIESAAIKNSFHPVQQYFNSLEWDGKPRLKTWLRDYLGAEKDPAEYLSYIGETWLKAAVKRVYKAGCKFDHMLVLEGGQGAGKSTVLEELATFGDAGSEEAYFTDGITISMACGNNKKDLVQQIQGSLIVELAELAGLNKKDDNDIKNWITNKFDTCRLPYAKRDTDFPRQFVLSGTTNDNEYLKDPTGNRRYWPVEVGKINLPAVKRDRVQLWAEAVALYKKDSSLWPTDEQIAMCKIEQEKRRSIDVWENKVMQIVKEIGDWDGAGFEIDRIMADMGFLPKDMNQREKVRIGAILRTNGYDIVRKVVDGKQKRVWCKV